MHNRLVLLGEYGDREVGRFEDLPFLSSPYHCCKLLADVTGGPSGSPAVLEQEQVAVTFWQQPMKRITEVAVVPFTPTAKPSMASPPESTLNGSPAWSPPYQWNSTGANQTNITLTINTTGTATVGTARFIFPSQMNPVQHLPPYGDHGV